MPFPDAVGYEFVEPAGSVDSLGNAQARPGPVIDTSCGVRCVTALVRCPGRSSVDTGVVSDALAGDAASAGEAEVICRLGAVLRR
jgi:hypothetical protein